MEKIVIFHSYVDFPIKIVIFLFIAMVTSDFPLKNGKI